ncbi:MAG TPA: hypothetical protein VG944_10715 [Fimbriimonas sp.]|nr:hypothetical protein [Fimbriimonas sp.]
MSQTSFQKIQVKRDGALLLIGGGIFGVIGSAMLLLLSFQKGAGVAGWIDHRGVSSLVPALVSAAIGIHLGRKARHELHE